MIPRDVAKAHKATAAALVEGTGEPRSREQIAYTVERALGQAYEAGAASSFGEARARTLREAIAIATGVEQEAAARSRGLQRELADLEKSRQATK